MSEASVTRVKTDPNCLPVTSAHLEIRRGLVIMELIFPSLDVAIKASYLQCLPNDRSRQEQDEERRL